VFTGGAPAADLAGGGHTDFAGQRWSESPGLVAGRQIRGLAVAYWQFQQDELGKIFRSRRKWESESNTAQGRCSCDGDDGAAAGG
jgi:hypothetical protein